MAFQKKRKFTRKTAEGDLNPAQTHYLLFGFMLDDPDFDFSEEVFGPHCSFCYPFKSEFEERRLAKRHRSYLESIYDGPRKSYFSRLLQEEKDNARD